ncbi:hypothetical protein EVA_13117 [gut metagenome]|uniref:Uncharacterized protein n=1 Tax=gut metagenome TaxID=749906 RepID=J9FW76_9ZZZZ
MKPYERKIIKNLSVYVKRVLKPTLIDWNSISIWPLVIIRRRERMMHWLSHKKL